MAKSFLRQFTQVSGSRTYDDTFTMANAEIDSSPNLEKDLNYVRTQLNLIVGETNWYDVPADTLSGIDDRIDNLTSSYVELTDTYVGGAVSGGTLVADNMLYTSTSGVHDTTDMTYDPDTGDIQMGADGGARVAIDADSKTTVYGDDDTYITISGADTGFVDGGTLRMSLTSDGLQLQGGARVNDTVTTITADDDTHLVTEGAVKDYVDTAVSGSNEWTELTDTPSSFSGNQYKLTNVNAGETALQFIDDLTYDGTTLNVAGDINSTGNVTVTGTLDVDGAVDLDSTLDVAGATIFQTTVNVQGAGDFDTTLNVDGNADFGSNVGVSGTFGFDSGTTVTEITTVMAAPGDDDTLLTEKAIYDYVDTISGSMVHNELEGLQGGTTDEYYHLTANEEGAFSSNGTTFTFTQALAGTSLSLSGDVDAVNADFSGTLDADGATTLGSTLDVTGAADFYSNVNISGTLGFDGGNTINNIVYAMSEPGSDDNLVSEQGIVEFVATVSGAIDDGLIWEIVDTPSTQIRPKVEHLQKAIYTEGNVTIGGDLTVTGTLFYTDTETVQVSDNILHINYGEVGAGVTAGEAGIQVDRGSETDYYFVFDEGTDTFRVGISGTQEAFNVTELQPVATREDNALDTRVTWWDDTNSTLRTEGDTYITVVSGGAGAIDFGVDDTSVANLTANAQTIGVATDTYMTINQSGDSIVFKAANTVEMALNTDGMKLKNSTIYVNDIQNVTDGDSISSSSLDTELATAKLIYTTLSGMNLMDGGTPTYMYYVDANGDIAETSNMTYDSASEAINFVSTHAAGDLNFTLDGQTGGSGEIVLGDPAGFYMAMTEMSSYETFKVWSSTAGGNILKLQPDNQQLGVIDETNIWVKQDTEQEIIFKANNIVGMTINSSGVTLSGGATVNEILDSTDAIDASSTDKQLATAKLIYDTFGTTAISGTPTYMYYVGSDGNMAETQYMTFDSGEITFGNAAVSSLINIDTNSMTIGDPTDVHMLFSSFDSTQRILVSTATNQVFSLSADLQRMGDGADAMLQISQNSDEIQLDILDTREMTVTSGGMQLKTGTSVNEIQDSLTGAIDVSSTDDQLATAALIYDELQNVTTGSGSITHNLLGGLQGGDGTDYYHLSAADYGSISNWDSAYSHSISAHAPSNADNTALNETSHADVVVDGDFTSDGILARDGGAGSYTVISGSGAITDVVTTVDGSSTDAQLPTAAAVWTALEGTDTFIELSDTPADYSGSENYYLRVNAAGDAVAFDSTINDWMADSEEPTGFTEYNTDSTITVTGTNWVSISGTYSYWIKGTKYEKSGMDSVAISDSTEGLQYVYFDGETLTTSTTWSDDYLSDYAYVAVAYWDDTNSEIIYLGDERHGMIMDNATHKNLHNSQGTVYISGLSPTDVLTDENGSVNTHAQFGMATGFILDEDLQHSISVVASTVGLPVFYKSGASGDWRRDTNSGYSFTVDGANTLPHWNEYTGGAWQRTEITDAYLTLVHVFATNDADQPYAAIMGEAEYSTNTAAREGANNEMNALTLAGMPFAEFVAVASFILQGNTGYANDMNARYISTDLGDDFVDWRNANVTGGGGVSATEHGNLAGLTDPNAHPASSIYTTTSAFDGALSSADDTVQKALDTLDNAIAGTAHQHYELDLTLSGSNVWTVTDASVADMQLADKDVYLNGLLNRDHEDYFTALVEGTKLTVTFAYNTYESDWGHVKFWKDETA